MEQATSHNTNYNAAIALVGMSGRFPGARTVAEFWRNITGRVKSIRSFSDEELLAAGIDPALLAQPNYVKVGSILEDIDMFDASFFKYSPREAEITDPQQRIFLECAWEALEDAGYNPETYQDLVGVFAGSAFSSYYLHHLHANAELMSLIGEMQASIGNDKDSLAPTVSYKFNLRGPSISVQTYCSTSLVAVHLACQSLLNYECDMALAGGVSITVPQISGYLYEEGGILSPDGECRTFDAHGQGSVMGNGAGVVLLKRMTEAIEDGDHIYAVILGSAVNNDGSVRVSYTAPGLGGQSLVIAQAQDNANIDVETIGYIEAHGTATALGDSIELAAMKKAFGRETQKKQFCAIGSVKPNIGHLDRASGVTGLIKATLALKHRLLPPSLNFERANDDIDLANSPFYVNTQLQEWQSGETPRRAGVSSFGVGGTNAHVVLEEAPLLEPSSPASPWQLLIISAKTANALDAATANLAAYLREHPQENLADIAYTLQVGRGEFNHRRFVICNNHTDAIARLERADQDTTSYQVNRDRPVYFLIPAQQNLDTAIIQELYQEEPIFRETIDDCLAILKKHGIVIKLNELLADKRSGSSDTTPLSLFILQYALARVFMDWEIRPGALLAEGSGEYVAACLSGVLSLEGALTVLARQAALDQPMEPMATAELTALFEALTLNPPEIPYLSNVTGTWITDEQATSPYYWAEQLSQGMKFTDGVSCCLQDTECVLLEAGTGDQHIANVIPMLPAKGADQSACAALRNALGKLWLAGATINWRTLYEDERRLRVSLPTYPFERQRYWLEAPTMGQAGGATAVSGNLGKKPDKGEWFYRLSWERSDLPTQTPLSPQSWLAFLDSDRPGEQVAEQMAQQGHSIVYVYTGKQFSQLDEQTFTIRPGEPDDYTQLCNELASKDRLPCNVLHAWNSAENDNEEIKGIDGFNPQQERGFYSLLFLAQALSAHFYDEPLHITVISSQMQAVTGQESLRPGKATIQGTCRVIPQEMPNISCRSIDIDDAAAIEQLVAECLHPAIDQFVAYRGNTRYVQTYKAITLPRQASETPLFRQQGVYLITGGLGGIGLTLAEHLARSAQARIVLVSRSGLPERETWQDWLDTHDAHDHTSQKIQRLQAIELQGGQLLFRKADVANAAEMQTVVQETLATFGALHGVFHAAGVTAESSFTAIENTGRDICETHFQAKVYGTYTLEQALQGIELDFCLLFSSLSAVLGGIGFVAYSAANMFLDAFAHAHNQRSTSQWTSINWDTWQVKDVMPSSLGATVMAFAMTPDEGVEALSLALASGEKHLVNSTGDLSARMRQWLRPQAGQGESVAASGTGDAGAWIPGEDYEQVIAAIWQQTLGIGQVGLHDNFFDIGGNSLVALEVISRLKKAFKRQIPAVAIFEAPTVSALAKYLRPASSVTTDQKSREIQQRRRQARSGAKQDDIAIIGMSGRFPGASSVEQFWQNLREGKESITRFTDEELLAAGVDPQMLQSPDYVKARPVLDQIDQFDANFFGYSPREAELTDPQHRLFLECAWEALEHAGYNSKTYKGLIGVFGGTNLSFYLISLLMSSPEVAQAIDGFQISIGNDKDSLTTTVSYKMNLRGPSFAVQTFCSTSLVATHLACQSLLHGECDMALAGGASVRVPDRVGYTYVEGGQESSDGHCRTFDAQSQGSVLGDGVGVVVLKRLSEALKDGDTIHAVIKGSAINNDGSLKVSYSAPSVAGQAEVVAQALDNAGVSAESISYVEAHGTATELGDPIEVASLTRAYRQHTDQVSYCAIGSVKTNVGHLDRAAGIASLIKTVMALKHEEIPPSLHYQSPNPEIDFEHSPFYVNTQLRPWPRGAQPRRAGINSLGMGGTNVHVVLEEAPEPLPGGPSRPWQLLPLSAKTETALQQATQNLLAYLQAHKDGNLADVAYTLQTGRWLFEHRRIVICRDHDDAIAALQNADSRQVFTVQQEQIDQPVAFLFPGVGEQHAGMTRELYQQEATFREAIDRCCTFLKKNFDLDLQNVLYPTDNRSNTEASSNVSVPDLRAMLGRSSRLDQANVEPLRQTELAQPAVFVIEYALAQLLMQWGIRPQALLGYSLGEYVAACIAGVLSLEDALTLVTRRAQLIQEQPGGLMLAVALSESAVTPYLNEQISLAIITAPNTCVLAGSPAAIVQLEQLLDQREIAHRRVETSHAFHSPMLTSLQEQLTELVRGMTLHTPQIPYISNVTGTWITNEQATDPAYWAQHMCQTVRFADGVGYLLEESEAVLLEVGPGQSLGSFIKQHPSCKRERLSRIVATLPASYDHQTDGAALSTALGKLWLAGVTPDWDSFYSNEQRRRIPLPTYPFERQSYWLEALKRPGHAIPAQTASSYIKRKGEIADWFYRTSWQQQPLEPTTPATTRAPWLVFADETGFAPRLIARLHELGHPVISILPGEHFAQLDTQTFTLPPHEQDAYRLLCETLARQGPLPRLVLHAWSLSTQVLPCNADTFQQVQPRGFSSLLALSRALSAHSYDEPISLFVLSTCAQQVLPADVIQPEHAPLLGACLIIPQEPLNLACCSIDLDLPLEGTWSASLIEQVLIECLHPQTDVVAYRAGARWVPQYLPVALPAPPAASTPFRMHGVYLITGGLGGIGLTLAEYLAQTVQARLVLLSRSSLPSRHLWQDWLLSHPLDDSTSQILHRLQLLEELGAQVVLYQADVADAEQLRRIIAETRETFGALHGVFHAAGITDARVFKSVQEIRWQECAVHFQAKVEGTYALASVLQGVDLDFCLLFSSLSAVLGGLGFLGYTAANSFLDAFAHRYNQQAGTPWQSVNWDTWQVKANAHGELGATIAAFAMQPQEAIEAMTRVLLSRHSHLINSTGDLHARLQQWRRTDLLLASRQSEHAASAPVNQGDYEQIITSIWQEVLGVQDPGLYDNFFDLGGNSLIALEVIGKLKKALRRPIPAVALFEAPTISALTRYLQPEAEVVQVPDVLAERRSRARQQTASSEIALIGMSGRFPGAPTIEQFWHNLQAGIESIRFFTPEELEAAGVPAELIAAPNYVPARPVLDDDVVQGFDAAFFGYSPREAELTDPQHRLFLECAWEALEQAGYAPQSYPGLIGIFGGTNISTYLFSADPKDLDGTNTFQLLAGNDKDSLTSTVSYKLNLRGPSFAVQTFCSTSLVAVHLACQSLLHGECDLALAGGASIQVPSVGGHLYEPGGMESPDGHCRTFDAQAKGSLFGDGVGLVTLKRLADAIDDGDLILAVIKGSAINNDGSLKVSYAAPSVAGQAQVVQAALERAGVSAESISYVEAHGTATELGDPIELASLTKAYRSHTEQVGYCAIGSVKTNVGHLDRAAGASGLIKTVLALLHEQLPASLHYQSPNPEIDFAHSPFSVNTQLRPWRRGTQPRRAGINSLGMGGTNAHVIVEEAPIRPPSGPSRPWQVLPLSARSPRALEQVQQRLAQTLSQQPELPLADVAYTLQVGRQRFEQRSFLVCQSTTQAVEQLMEPLSPYAEQRTDRPVAFLLAGVGEQYAGMSHELYQQETAFREAMERCCSILQPLLGLDLREALFAEPAESVVSSNGTNGYHDPAQTSLHTSDLRALLGRNGTNGHHGHKRKTENRATLARTDLAQPLLFVVEYALAQLLMQWGIRPQAMLGYSLGEYVAACLSGVLSLDDALTLVAKRAQLISQQPTGVMVAVSLPVAEILPYLTEEVSLSAINGPTTCVLAGPPEALTRVTEQLTQQGIAFRHVETTHAFHSQMLDPLREQVTELARGLTLHPPSIPYISNVTGTWITAEQATDPAYWAEHMCQTVRFADGIGQLLQGTEYALLEIGPGQSLGSFVKQHPACDRERIAMVIGTMPAVHERQSEQAFLLTTLGKLWQCGVSIDWTGFYKAEQRQRVLLPTYPFERQRYWLEPRKDRARSFGLPSSSSAEKDITNLKREALSDWFYVSGWKQTAPVQAIAPDKQAHRTWLVFLDSYGPGWQLLEQLRQRGDDVITVQPAENFACLEDASRYTLRPDARNDYDALLKDLQASGKMPQHILHLWTITEEPVEPTEILNRGFYSLFALAQSLGDMDFEQCQITVISNGIQNVTGHEEIAPLKATVIGPCRVVPQEYPNLSCRSIDILLPPSGSRQEDTLIKQLMGELTAEVCDTVIALRGNRRWVPCFDTMPLDVTTSQMAAHIRKGGTYLITGGFGGIGLAMGEWLAREMQARLILVGRHALPPREQWSDFLATDDASQEIGRRIRKVLELETFGAQVLPLQADVADESQMQTVIEQAEATFGPIHGVLHTAGVPGIGLTQLKTVEQVSGVLAPKVQGTLVLERVLKGHELDFLILFSSITSTTGGGPGQIDYCAANAFLDAYAQSRAGGSWPVVSIDWGEWQWNGWEAGLAGYNPEVQAFLRENRQKFGIAFAEGCDALLRVLSTGLPHVVVSTQDFCVIAAESKRFTAANILQHGREQQQSRTVHPRPETARTYVPPRNESEQKIAAIWEQLLGIAPIGIHDNFFEMGGNSLTGIDLIARLRKTFNLETLASHILYEAPSVSALAQHIEQGHEKGKTHEPVKERLERGGKRRDSLKQRSARHRTQEHG